MFRILKNFIIFSVALFINFNVLAIETTLPANNLATNGVSGSAVSMPNVPAKPTIAVPTLTPSLPDFDLKAYILIDANSGYVIASKNAEEHLPPASITKLTSLYIIADALKTGRLHMEDMVSISENAWRMGGSKMFIKVGDKLPVQDLINGIVIASGNDATVAMAEHIAGSEESFVSIMNQVATNLGMKDTHYADSNGLPADNHYSSARDIAILARDWIFNFPEYYPWFKQKTIVFNNIQQSNRNRLLWQDHSVDGMKTGHTDEAGFCLLASAERNGMRLISVVLGAPAENLRNTYSETLLNFGFRFYETHLLYKSNAVLTKSKVWYGSKSEVSLGVARDLYVTIPSGQYDKMQANIVLNKNLKAPLKKGQVCGSVNIMLNDKTLVSQPLIALDDVSESGFFGRIFDRILMFFGKK